MFHPGIRNTGNQCFINSALQCLSVSPVIIEFISKYINKDNQLLEVISKYNLGKFKANSIKTECSRILLEQSEAINTDEKIILEKLIKHSFDIYIYISFREIIRQLNNTYDEHKVINNGSFLSIIEDLSKNTGFEHLFNGEQNDPHEFMAYLLDKLHNAKSTSVTIDLPQNINNLDIYSQLHLKDFKSRYENDYSYFVKNFYYYILNCVQCSKCKHKSHSVCPNDIMCLSIPNKELSDDTNISNNITLYNCLDEMFKIDNINYKCEKCENIENNLIEKKILSEPKTLIIKLKRYSTNYIRNRIEKITKMIEYPNILNINNYYCGNDLLKYKLYAIINHTGTMNGGHYYSYIKTLKDDNTTFNDQWICCNDSQVSNISEEEAMNSQNAYILFYTI